MCSCCAATPVRGFLSSLANINEFSLAVSLCRREGCHLCFTDRETEVQRSNNICMDTQHLSSTLIWADSLPGALTCSCSFWFYPHPSLLHSDCNSSCHSVWWLCKLWLQKWYLPIPSLLSHSQAVLRLPIELPYYFFLMERSFVTATSRET